MFRKKSDLVPLRPSSPVLGVTDPARCAVQICQTCETALKDSCGLYRGRQAEALVRQEYQPPALTSGWSHGSRLSQSRVSQHVFGCDL